MTTLNRTVALLFSAVRRVAGPVALFVVATYSSGGELAPPAEPSPLAPMAFLAGSCWVAAFPDGEATDEHCFEWVYGGKFLRDRHVVRGRRDPYQGETWYGWDAEQQSIAYWYFNSLGGVSTGTGSSTAEGLVFPERHASDSGVREFRNVWRQTGHDSYCAVLTEKRGPAWVEVWTMEFTRTSHNPMGAPALPQSVSAVEISPVGDPQRPLQVLRLALAGGRALVDLELGDTIEGQRLRLVPGLGSEGPFRALVRYETSLTVMNEGPHLDLHHWKHHLSNWRELERLNALEFLVPSLTPEETNAFPASGADELRAAVHAAGGERWAALLPAQPAPTEYPLGVGPSRYWIAILEPLEDVWVEVAEIEIRVPMGC